MTIRELISWRDSVASEVEGYALRGEYENSYHLIEEYDRLSRFVREVEEMGVMKQLDVIAQENPELTWEELVEVYNS